MGYFNYFIRCFIRKFVNTFFSRRKLTKLFIISLIFCVIIMLLHNEGYCTSDSSVGVYAQIDEIVKKRESIFSDYLKQFTYWFYNVASSSARSRYQSAYYSFLSESSIYNIYIDSSGTNLYFYDSLDVTDVINSNSFGVFNVPCAKVKNWKTYCYSFTPSWGSSPDAPPFGFFKNDISVTPVSRLPTSFYGRNITYVFTPEIRAMAGASSAQSPIGKSDVNNVTNSINNVNDSINNDNVEDSSITMVEDTSENPTDSGFDNIFTIIYNAFCNTSSSPLTITIPYINESFSIQPNMLSNSLKKDSRLNAILVFIQSFWWFKISLFIFKDVNNYIEEFKNGNITTDDGNIKTEVL